MASLQAVSNQEEREVICIYRLDLVKVLIMTEMEDP
jgi:hypothetical protein